MGKTCAAGERSADSRRHRSLPRGHGHFTSPGVTPRPLATNPGFVTEPAAHDPLAQRYGGSSARTTGGRPYGPKTRTRHFCPWKSTSRPMHKLVRYAPRARELHRNFADPRSRPTRRIVNSRVDGGSWASHQGARGEGRSFDGHRLLCRRHHHGIFAPMQARGWDAVDVVCVSGDAWGGSCATLGAGCGGSRSATRLVWHDLPRQTPRSARPHRRERSRTPRYAAWQPR